MARTPIAAFALVLVVLVVAMVVPAVMLANTDRTTSTATIGEGNTTTIVDADAGGLNGTVNTANPSNVTFTLRDLESGESSKLFANESETVNATLGDEVLNVTATNTTDAEATLAVDHDTLYGYSGGAKVFMSNLGVMLIGVVVLMVAMVLVAVVR